MGSNPVAHNLHLEAPLRRLKSNLHLEAPLRRLKSNCHSEAQREARSTGEAEPPDGRAGLEHGSRAARVLCPAPGHLTGSPITQWVEHTAGRWPVGGWAGPLPCSHQSSQAPPLLSPELAGLSSPLTRARRPLLSSQPNSQAPPLFSPELAGFQCDVAVAVLHRVKHELHHAAHVRLTGAGKEGGGVGVG